MGAPRYVEELLEQTNLISTHVITKKNLYVASLYDDTDVVVVVMKNDSVENIYKFNEGVVETKGEELEFSIYCKNNIAYGFFEEKDMKKNKGTLEKEYAWRTAIVRAFKQIKFKTHCSLRTLNVGEYYIVSVRGFKCEEEYEYLELKEQFYT